MRKDQDVVAPGPGEVRSQLPITIAAGMITKTADVKKKRSGGELIP